MEEEKTKMNGEIWGLRDRVQEVEWQNRELERKLKERMEGEVEGGENRLDQIEKRLEKGEKEMKEVAKQIRTNSNQPTNSSNNVNSNSNNNGNNNGNSNNNNDNNNYNNNNNNTAARKRCVILTDSNGREITPDSVKRYIVREERDEYNVELVIAYTLEEAIRRVERREIDVNGSKT